jgi:hypothetical protein
VTPVFVDPPELRERGDVDLGDPLERAAMALHTLSWNTPADARRLLQGDMKDLIPSWIGATLEARERTAADRMLARQRAAVILEAYGIEDEEIAAA